MIDPIVAYFPTLLYGLALLLAGFDLWNDVRWLRFAALTLVGVGLVARIVTLLEPGFCPLTAGGSGMVIALFLALYGIISHQGERDQRAKTTSLIGLVMLLDLSGQLFGEPARAVPPPPKERALGELHGGLVLLAYACFLIGAIYSALYLVLYRHMKRRRIGFWFDRLPPLQHLEAKASRSTFVGLLSLTVGLSIGLYSYAVFRGGLPYDNIKFVVAALVWLLFAAELVVRRGLHWKGIRVIWMPIVGVLVIGVLSSVGGGHPFWSPR